MSGQFMFGGFVFDWRRPNSGMWILNHHTTGMSTIRGLLITGMHNLGCQGPLRVNPSSETAKTRIQYVDMRYSGQTYQKTINDRDTRSGGGPRGRSWATSGITMYPRA